MKVCGVGTFRSTPTGERFRLKSPIYRWPTVPPWNHVGNQIVEGPEFFLAPIWVLGPHLTIRLD